MKDIKDMAYHPTAEKLVAILCERTQNTEPLFFRVLVGYYFSVVAAHMRCMIATPDRGEIPINMYALNLSPSGTGKGHSTAIIEEEVIHLFRERFMEETFGEMAEQHLAQVANRRAISNGTDPDQEYEMAKRDFAGVGEMLFSFDSATAPAIKQIRQKTLMANAGAVNLEIDEIGMNLTANVEALAPFLELYDKGRIKSKLTKSTADNARTKEFRGASPANLMMFGAPSRLFDGSVTEQQFYSLLDTGYARRCLFGYIRAASKNLSLTPEQIFNMQTNTTSYAFLNELSSKLENLADIINANKRLAMKKETSLALIKYKSDCERQAALMGEHDEIRKTELSHRYFKALKLAGAYAFVDDSPELTMEHLENAIKLVEESGASFGSLLNRDRNYVKLAKYLAQSRLEVTHADMIEDLPFYKGSASVRNEMLTLAIAYGYKNNIVIKKSFQDGIEFLRGESLKETNLKEMVVSYSNDMTTGYRNERVPFDQMHRLTQAPNMHWVNHHLLGGYRNEENAEAGFNMLVIDVDGTCNMSTAKMLMQEYKALYYTTKSHTPDNHRFRIILPLSHELRMDAKDYKEFIKNVFEWLPFDVDESGNHRCKKWLTNLGHYEYVEGKLFDVLPFIPKTSKNEERKIRLESQQSMDNLERWILNNSGDGNRNNMLLKFAMILVDAGFDFEGVRSRVIGLNDKMPDKLDEAEIMGSIMVTAGKAIAARP